MVKRARYLPEAVVPQVPIVTDRIPRGRDWVHEIKYRGYRTLAYIRPGSVRLVNRHEHDWAAELEPIARALHRVEAPCVIDGELTVLDRQGLSSAGDLGHLVATAPGRISYCAFDLIWSGARDWRPQPLVRRKAALRRLLVHALESERVFYSDHVSDGCALFDRVIGLGGLGIVSKNAGAPYLSGPDATWVKIDPRRVGRDAA